MAQHGPTWPSPEVQMQRATTERTVGIVTGSLGAAVVLIGELTHRNNATVDNGDAHLAFGLPLMAVGITLNLTANNKTRKAFDRYAQVR